MYTNILIVVSYYNYMKKWTETVGKNKWVYLGALVWMLFLRIFYGTIVYLGWDLQNQIEYVVGEYTGSVLFMLFCFTIYWLFTRKKG